MRARDYAFLYQQEPTDQNLAEIASDFLREIPAIVRKRKIILDEGARTVVLEQDQKWRCFARQASRAGDPTVDPDGLKNLIAKKYPAMYAAVWRDGHG